MIFFAILASSTIGCVSSVYMAASQLVDANHRYRPDRINERTKSINGLIEWVLHKVIRRLLHHAAPYVHDEMHDTMHDEMCDV